MRTYHDAKAMAKSLRNFMAARNISLSHSECLEAVADQFGFTDWNTLNAKLEVEVDRLALRGIPAAIQSPPNSELDVKSIAKCDGACQTDTVAKAEQPFCSFCGKSQFDVRRLVEGNCARPRRKPENCVFICDECVALCAQINADSNAKTLEDPNLEPAS
jgi:hypothetical protein